MKQILIILPSKARPEKVEGFYRTWRQTTDGYSDVLTCLDDDDKMLKRYNRYPDIKYNTGKGGWVCDVYNRAYYKYPNYKYYYLVADDIRFRSTHWEKAFMTKLEKNGGKGICYGNDLMFMENLSTAPFISGKVIRALGYIALPGLWHMWVDKFWYEVGIGLNKLFYFPDLIMEHIHYKVGKSHADPQYLSFNTKKVYEHDKQVFLTWEKKGMEKDLLRIREYQD